MHTTISFQDRGHKLSIPSFESLFAQLSHTIALASKIKNRAVRLYLGRSCGCGCLSEQLGQFRLLIEFEELGGTFNHFSR